MNTLIGPVIGYSTDADTPQEGHSQPAQLSDILQYPDSPSDYRCITIPNRSRSGEHFAPMH